MTTAGTNFLNGTGLNFAYVGDGVESIFACARYARCRCHVAIVDATLAVAIVIVRYAPVALLLLYWYYCVVIVVIDINVVLVLLIPLSVLFLLYSAFIWYAIWMWDRPSVDQTQTES